MSSIRQRTISFCLVLVGIAVGLILPTAGAAEDRNPSEAFLAVAEAGATYLNDTTQCPGVIAATSLYDSLNDYTVIDIRAQHDYEFGHVPGAYHSSLANLVDDLAVRIPSHKPYVLACYSGQSSSQAKIAMELLGYDDVFNLNFGMAAWHTTLTAPWDNACADNLNDPETENQNGNLTVQPYPELAGDPETVVAERVGVVLASGFRGVRYSDIADNLDDYFIINYFGPNDYEGAGNNGVPGHIPGAFQFTPYASLGLDQMLNRIPIDMPVVVYDWTGQHSAQVTTFLNMLGYDAYSLKYGVNSLFYSSLTSHRWNPSAVVDLPLEEGSGPTSVDDLGWSTIAAVSNHPNPFNPVTTISYRLQAPARVRLQIFDMAGRQVRELLRGVEQVAGSYAVDWRGRNDSGRLVPTGTYLYRIDAGGASMAGRMALIK